MRLRSSSTQVGDPFFDAVRRRHPDVDLVLLPPEQPSLPEADGGIDPDAALTRLREVAERLLTPVTGLPPDVAFRFGADEGRVRATARSVARTDAADGDAAGDAAGDEDPLAVLEAALLAGGWAVRRTPGVVARLDAALDDLDLTATHAAAAGALVLTLRAEDLVVGVDRARLLVTGGRAEGGR
jgi:hypothetical protein